MPQNTKQNLVLFLDGTWNTEDDSTNILKMYHIVQEGIVVDNEGDEVLQKKYYDRGVGTNTLDRVTGGGFGFGLEKNVREAYNWLVENYNSENGDKIFIFGFSRGAYTARSLVGLIAACGLVRREAPMTVSQLWRGYIFISKNRHQKEYSWWKKRLTRNQYLFRRLTTYKDSKKENGLINKSEKLIRKWSRRVNIEYLGIFDTVGAMGINALGIPGIQSQLDSGHNTSPTQLIQNCRHALAIDEHRSSFRLTPFLNYIHKGKETKDNYKGRIEQRWFVGAHSNIGGGYENNVLATRPFEWVKKGAEKSRLVCRKPENFAEELKRNPHFEEILNIAKEAEKPKVKDIRDSFVEMGGGAWQYLLREKRNLRQIGRPDLVRESYLLRTLYEEIDDSVVEFFNNNSDYAPDNLLTYLLGNPEKREKFAARLKMLGDKRGILQNDKDIEKELEKLYTSIFSKDKDGNIIKNTVFPFLLLVVWSVIAAFGVAKVFSLPLGNSLENNAPLLLFSLAFILINWVESLYNLKIIRNPQAKIAKVLSLIAYTFRLLGVIFFMWGLLSVLRFLVQYLYI